MGCCSQSSPSQHTQAEAEHHQGRVFLTVQWLQIKQRQGKIHETQIPLGANVYSCLLHLIRHVL